MFLMNNIKLLYKCNVHKCKIPIRLLGSQGKGKETEINNLLNNAATFEDLKPNNPEQVWATLPYTEGASFNRHQGAHSLKPQIDPRETSIILFPGQGTQYVGMAKNLMKFPMARDLFELANYTLGYDLLKMCLEGPLDELTKTVHCQLAVMVTSLAALEKLKEERPNAIDQCYATAGFSLGEITALVFAGAIPFERALRLVQIRAEAMQLACDLAQGTMATVLYGPDSELNLACIQARQWCIENGVENPECSIASYMYPHCKVIAGNEEAIEFIEKNYKQFKLRRIKRLAVTGAFHTQLMKSAVEPFRKALEKSKISDPIISVHSNVDGKRYRNANHIIQQLPKQIVKPVKWEQTLHVLYERDCGDYFPRTFECGPQATLRPLLKQVNGKAWNNSFSVEA